MSKIREILLARRSDVLREMAPLQAELREIDQALAAISQEPKAIPQPKPGRPTSISAQVVDLLAGFPDGMTTSEFVSRMRSEHGREINNRNMSWHLSRLKREQLLVQLGERWKLKEQTPDVGASGVSGGEIGVSPRIESRDVREVDIFS